MSRPIAIACFVGLVSLISCGGGGSDPPAGAGATMSSSSVSNVTCDDKECTCGPGKTCEGKANKAKKIHCDDATCNITVEDEGFVLCTGNKGTCNLILGKDAIAECEFGATCTLKCGSSCTALCEEMVKSCTLTCGSAAPISTTEPSGC
jgi:hypothetical protein